MSDRVIYTGVQCRVDHFLRMPQCWRHVLDLAGLVIGHQRLGRLESGLAREEGSGDCASIVSFMILRALEPKLSNWTYEGSVMPIVWRTRPIYVPRSYWEAGSSRAPGSEADMFCVSYRIDLNGVFIGVEMSEGRCSRARGRPDVRRRWETRTRKIKKKRELPCPGVN